MRPEAKYTISKLQGAGIKTLMLTGDHEHSAYKNALDSGLIDDKDSDETKSPVISCSEIANFDENYLHALFEDHQHLVFARCSPLNKIQVLKALKSFKPISNDDCQKLDKEIVCFVGDGLNDAPGFKHANLGISMSVSGNILCMLIFFIT